MENWTGVESCTRFREKIRGKIERRGKIKRHFFSRNQENKFYTRRSQESLGAATIFCYSEETRAALFSHENIHHAETII